MEYYVWRNYFEISELKIYSRDHMHAYNLKSALAYSYTCIGADVRNEMCRVDWQPSHLNSIDFRLQ